jgi:hypothetical protein
VPKQDGSPTAAEQKAHEQALPQHPALDGHEGIEVAERSQDETRLSTTTHRKDFVLLASAYGSNDKDEIHRANIEATRQAMIGQGLRPTGDGKFVSSEKHPDGKSITLTYEVPAKPSVVVTVEEPDVLHAHVALDDQHEAEKNGHRDPSDPPPEGDK